MPQNSQGLHQPCAQTQVDPDSALTSPVVQELSTPLNASNAMVNAPASAVQMPGLFAPPGMATAPNPDNPSITLRTTMMPCQSPNPFLTSTPTLPTGHLAQGLQQGGTIQSLFPAQLLRNTHLAQTNNPFTPPNCITVLTTVGTASAPYHSLEVLGPANFGPSVSQHDLWDDMDDLPTDPVAGEFLPDNNDNDNGEFLLDIAEEDDLSYTTGSHASAPPTMVSLGTAVSYQQPRLEAPLIASGGRGGQPLCYGAAVHKLGPVSHHVGNVISYGRYSYTFSATVLAHNFQGTAQEFKEYRERYR
ncbi:hypothetical protein BJ165DRAFT_1534027 [Panaeolus papilionaceus]|nr:hypothetical protein BJ165DRAFT_1534027 [Panaeolus papilionaceus]